MGMTTKRTCAKNLQKVINNNMVIVRLAKIESKEIDHTTKVITAEQFNNDLDWYLESGIFADTLDFKYELQDKNLTVDIGNLSPYCDYCITVDLIVNDDVSKDDLENILKRVNEM